MKLKIHLMKVFLLVFAFATVQAAELFTITATFGTAEDPDLFTLAEHSARLDACSGDNFGLLNNKLKADCISMLLNPLAVCKVISGELTCNVGGVQVKASDVKFACIGDCPSVDAVLGPSMVAAAACAPESAQPGFLGNCFQSAFCLEIVNPAPISFGDFCPSATGEYCCGHAVTRDLSAFPTPLPIFTPGDVYRGIDYIVDMDIKVFYDVKAPAQLQLKVEVPYVSSTSTMSYVENNGATVDMDMCPTTYLIDLLPPLETYPGNEPSDRRERNLADWRPLAHFPNKDLFGRPRSTCGNYDMSYANEAEFVSNFKFPDFASDTFTYGAVPSVVNGVWDTSQGVVGIPNGAVTFWNKGPAVGLVGEQRLNYTAGAGIDGHFDLVKAWSKCQNLANQEQLVKKQAVSETTNINGVSYPVETFEWTLSVCSAGYFGRNCRTNPNPQMYAKTCTNTPAAFSVTPQQVSHVTVNPVTEQLVSKSFLQSIDAFSSDCDPLFERVAVTLNLVIFSTDYEIVAREEHDLLSPAGVFLQSADASNFFVVATNNETMNKVSFDEFLASETLEGRNLGQGVYVLNKREVSGPVTVYYRKVVIVSQCFKTDVNVETGIRGSPNAFMDAISTPGQESVLFDLEVVLEKSKVIVGSGSVDLSGVIKNTLNLRILATKETFILPSKAFVVQKAATAYQKLYGSYESARADVALSLPDALPVGSTMSAGDQVCSKHQLESYDAQVANLTPNAAAVCMLATNLPAWAALAKGTTILYRNTGMKDPVSFTYGCFPDWIDIEGKTPTLEDGQSVYVFRGAIPRFTGAHESIFWLVQRQKLEDTQELNGELMRDRFGAALFFFNTTGGLNNDGSTFGAYDSQTSAQFQVDQNTQFTTNPAGCVVEPGALKSSCNLVCFDIVDRLLTDPVGAAERELLVHHISVASIEIQDIDPANRFTSRRLNRRLLETVAITLPGTRSGSAGADANADRRDALDGRSITLGVLPGPRTQNGTQNDTKLVVMPPKETTKARKVEGPAFFAIWFFPLFFILISLTVAILGCCLIAKRRTKGQMNYQQLTEKYYNTNTGKS